MGNTPKNSARKYRTKLPEHTGESYRDFLHEVRRTKKQKK